MKKVLFNLLFLIPIINGIATSVTGYFLPGTLNPGTIRAIIIGIPLIFFIILYYPKQKINLVIFGYTAYLLVLVAFSSDPAWSFYMYIKVALGFLMFPLGYYFIKSKGSLKKLITSYAFTLVILLLNVLISNIFNLGTSDYLDETFYFGVSRVNITTSMIILVIVAPVAFHFFQGSKKILLISLYFSGLLISLIGIKRSVLLTTLAAPVVYGLFTRYKKRLVKSLLILLLLLGSIIFLFPDYYRTFTDRFQARQESGSFELSEKSLNQQARVNEFELVTESWIKGSFRHKLIGSEWLNDMYFYRSGRMLHTDYMVLLNGAGAIGFLTWFLILFLIFNELFKYYHHLKHITFYTDLMAVSVCILVAQLIMSISGTLYSIDLRCLIMLFWGAALGVMRSGYLELKGNSVYLNVATAKLEFSAR